MGMAKRYSFQVFKLRRAVKGPQRTTVICIDLSVTEHDHLFNQGQMAPSKSDGLPNRIHKAPRRKTEVKGIRWH